MVVSIKKGDSDANEMLSELFVIADTFYKELYGKSNEYNAADRRNTIRNFESILAEDIKQYEDDRNEAIVTDTNGKKLTLEGRAERLRAMIHPNGFRQFIWNKTYIVHELYTDISEKTGNYVKSRNMIVIDMMPGNGEYVVCAFTRVDSEEKTKELAEGIWGAGKFNPAVNESTRHVVCKIPYSEKDEKIAEKMKDILAKVKEYRDSTYSLNK